MIDSYSNKYILHVDGDGFFASCEVAVRPHLRGKPVVVGKERSIVTALSYEAKRLGLSRGMFTGDIRKKCPEAIILSSDYLLYKIFSNRMFSILSRFTLSVEHYSIDECFADITDAVLEMKGEDSNEEKATRLGQMIKADIEKELGMTVSVGIGRSKVIAKLGSKKNKPSGFYICKTDAADAFGSAPVGSVWGIGPNMSIWLGRYGINTINDFVSRKRIWIESECDKHVREIWYELNGISVIEVNAHETAEQVSSGFGNASQATPTADSDQKSIQRTRTFFPHTSSPDVLQKELSSHAEEACARLRGAGLVTNSMSFFLKTKDFRYKRTEIHLELPTNLPQEILKAIKKYFDMVYVKGTEYRASGITLGSLRPERVVQGHLFDDVKIDSWREATNAVIRVADRLEDRFGRGIINLASSNANAESKRFYLPEILLR